MKSENLAVFALTIAMFALMYVFHATSLKGMVVAIIVGALADLVSIFLFKKSETENK